MSNLEFKFSKRSGRTHLSLHPLNTRHSKERTQWSPHRTQDPSHSAGPCSTTQHVPGVAGHLLSDPDHSSVAFPERSDTPDLPSQNLKQASVIPIVPVMLWRISLLAYPVPNMCSIFTEWKIEQCNNPLGRNSLNGTCHLFRVRHLLLSIQNFAFVLLSAEAI